MERKGSSRARNEGGSGSLRYHGYYIGPVVLEVPSSSCDDNIPRLVTCWENPIVVGRHAFGDQYKSRTLSRQAQAPLKCPLPPSLARNNRGKCTITMGPVSDWRVEGISLHKRLMAATY